MYHSLISLAKIASVTLYCIVIFHKVCNDAVKVWWDI